MKKLSHAYATCLKATSVLSCAAFISVSHAQPASQATPQAANEAAQEIVITANRTPQLLKDVLADVTVISRLQIEASGAMAVAEILSKTPGVQISNTGGPGATTSVFVRGAETRFTAVYIDGVRVDSQATGGAPWEGIPLSQIERIEIVRGPAAVIYGSDAIGGVIQLFTRKGRGVFTPFASLGFGTDNTQKINSGFSGELGMLDYSAGLAHDMSQGFNSQAGGNPDIDGYKRISGNMRLGLKVNADHQLDATVLSSGIDAQYDGYKSSKDDHAKSKLQTLGLTWRTKWSDSFSTKAVLTQGSTHYDTAPTLYSTDTRVRAYLLQNELRLGSNQLATAVLERREDTLKNASITPAETYRSQTALALGYGLTLEQHTLQLNTRQDSDSEFGRKSTVGAAYAYHVSANLRATASVGTAFRSPTLYQRFSEYGKASLQPESSVNQEVSLKYASLADSVDVTAYKNKIDNLIVFVSGAKGCTNAYGCYDSTSHADLTGVTVTGGTKLSNVSLAASLDFLRAINSDTGNRLARRANKTGLLSAQMPVLGWQLGSEIQLVGQRFDDANNKVGLGGFGLVNIYGTRTIEKNFSVLLRINNLTNHWYQLANTYNTPGRSLFAGARWEM